MVRYVVKIKYDGTLFHGLQKQNKNLRTIQGEIENGLKNIFKKEIKTHFASRTDKGVHALEQIFHFDIEKEFESEENLKKALKVNIARDISVLKLKKVNNLFHSRYDALKKRYVYILYTGEHNPLLLNYALFVNKEIKLRKLKKALKEFKGNNNFFSFCGSEGEVVNYKRNISKIKAKKKENFIFITIEGRGFLRYMIRMIIGSALEVSKEKKDIDYIRLKLKSKQKKSPYKVSSSGLYLEKIKYKERLF